MVDEETDPVDGLDISLADFRCALDEWSTAAKAGVDAQVLLYERAARRNPALIPQLLVSITIRGAS